MIITPYTENEVYQLAIDLNNFVLDKLHLYIDTTEIVTDGVLQRLLSVFIDHFSPGIFPHYVEYTTSVIGRQMNNPVAEGVIFAPTQENYQEGHAYITGPHRHNLLTTYLFPLAMYATIYYSSFPFFLDPMKAPHLVLNYESYNDFRDNQTYVSLQARYGLIRKFLSEEVLGFTDTEEKQKNNPDDPKANIEFYKFENSSTDNIGGFEE